jgi:hypothetical protein
MNSKEPKCGDDCKLVEMLVSKTSKQQAMENAMALYLADPESISIRGAAKQCGVDHSALAKRIKKKSCAVWQEPHHTTQKSKSSGTKPTDEERQEWWRLHTEEGLTANAIHKKTGRNRETITKEIKSRKSRENTPEATERPPFDDQPVTPTGELNDHMKALVKRESKSSKDRLKIVAALKEIKKPLEMTMKAASKEFRFGRGIVYQDVMAAERQLAKDGNPGIRETLEEVAREAELVRKFATESLRLLQLDRDEA